MKIFIGKVISTKMDKTAVVAVERIIAHPVYLKRYKRTKKYLVHHEHEVKEGQRVKFCACKPYSKLKKWKIIPDGKSDVKTVVKKVSVKKVNKKKL